MKIAKIVGLAAVAALALLALLGPGSALAAPTTLCKTEASSPYYFCSGGGYAKGTSLATSSTNATFETSVGKIACSESTLEGKTTAESGTPLGVDISTWTFGNCVLGGATKCTATSGTGPYAGTLAWTSQNNGSLVVGTGGSGAPTVLIKCGFLANCTYSLGATLDASGGNPATIVASQEPISGTGVFCPSTNQLSGTYTVNSPNPVYVANFGLAEAHTRLCEATENPCVHAYPAGTTISAETSSVTIATNVSKITCKKGSLTAHTEALGASPLPVTVTSFPLQECSWAGIGSCTATTTNVGPASLGSWIGSPNNGIWKGEVSWLFSCGFNKTCKFRLSSGSELPFYGGNPATLLTNKVVLDIVEGTICPSIAEMTTTLTVTAPKPLYVE